MGTTVSITVADAEQEKAQAAVLEAQEELRRLGREWYPWASEGELVRLNAALAEGKRLEVSPLLAQVLRRSQKYAHLSGGAFDPAVGGLVRLWGFDRVEHDGRLPTQKERAAWRKDHPRFSDLQVDDRTVRSDRRDVIIDLGAIGKGFAVDRAIEILRSRGVEHALVNAGGNLRGIGHGPGGPWRIAIRNPRAVAALAWLELSDDESVSTSGDYERFAFARGKRIHHLLDPRSGEVADHTLAVTVVAADATLADAASTALFVAGPADWLPLAKSLGIKSALRVGADGKIQVTRALRDRLVAKSGTDRPPDWEVVDIIDP